MCHVLAVPGIADIAFAIHDNQAACALGLRAKHRDGRLSRFTRNQPAPYEISRSFSDQQANEIFSIARTGNSRVLIGIEAAAYQWRIAHPSGILVVKTAR